MRGAAEQPAQVLLRTLARRTRLVGGSLLVSAGIYFYIKQQKSRRDALVAAAKAKRAAVVAGGGGEVSGAVSGRGAAASARTRKVGVDMHFVTQLQRLLPICVPGVRSKEFGLLITLAVVLLGRTWLDIWFSAFNGEVVKAIVTRDKKAFIRKAIIEFGMMMWPMSVVNNLLKLTISALAVSFRTRLTRHAHEMYLRRLTFYKVSNLDNRLSNADQLLTQDIDKFSDNLSHLYSDIAKPAVDIVLFAIKLGQALGSTAPFYMVSYFLAAGATLRFLSPPFGKYIAQEQKLEGEYRFHHSRIITHSEEIAFYGGNERERGLISASFEAITKHIRKIYQQRFANGVVDSILVKYCATITAYILLARPVFDPTSATELMGAIGADPTQLIEDYSRNSGYLVKLSQAVGSLMMEARHLAQFAGYTHRVAELFDVLEDVNNGKYERTMVAAGSNEPSQQTVDTTALRGRQIIQDHIIKFDNVPVVTPNGDVLVRNLSFEVRSGMNCLITGPNGCGKSSLFRILGDLWPQFDGVVTKPHQSKLFYVPQRPYLAIGTLRDQVIYPYTRAQAQMEKGVDDNALLEILKVVHLEYLVTREGGWDSVADWADVLSGGEKQRVAMARLFFHRPQFAILDECTSQVSVDVEGIMYTHARALNITLFTVSHRPSLVKYHDHLLRFSGEGTCAFDKLDHSQNAFDFGHGKSAQSPQLSTSST